MRKLFTLSAVAIATFITTSAFAQLKVGVKGGLNLANVGFNYDDSDFEPSTKFRPLFHVGAALEYGLTDNFAIQSALLFTQKGYSVDLEDDLEEYENIDGYDRYTFNYIEMPIHGVVKFSIFQAYLGPYIAAGIGGKNKENYSYEDNNFKIEFDEEYDLKPTYGEVEDSDFSDDETPYMGLDFGLSAGVGVELGDLQINAGYSHGLGNLAPNYSSDSYDRKDYRRNHRVFNVSVAYYFLK